MTTGCGANTTGRHCRTTHCPPALRRLACRLALLLALCCALWLPGETAAQSSRPLAPLDASSPGATLGSFLDLARQIEAAYLAYRAAPDHARARAFEEGVGRAATLFDTSDLPPAFRQEVAGAAFAFLFDILLRLPVQDLDRALAATADSDPQSPFLIPGTEIAIVKMEEGDRAGRWLFSPATLAQLPEFHRVIIGFPLQQASAVENWHRSQSNLSGPFLTGVAIDRLPDRLTHTALFDTPVWKLLLTLAIWFAIACILILWMQALARLTEGAGKAIRLLARLSAPALLALMLLWARSFVDIEVNLSGGGFAQVERAVTLLALYVAAAWALWLTILTLVEAVIASPVARENPFSANLLRLVGKVLALLSAGFLLILGLNEVGVPALGLVAGLGVGGFAVALAARATVENLFGGLTLFADRPFRVGDFVDFEGGSGFVENIGPRSSRLRGHDGALTTVPNSELVNARIINYSLRNKCLFLQTLGLGYKTTPEQLECLLAEIRGMLLAHPMIERSADLPRVNVTDFGNSAINIEVRAHVPTTDYGRFLEVQEELLVAIMRAAEHCGVRLATRTHTVFIDRSDAGAAGPGAEEQARGPADAPQQADEPRSVDAATGR